MQSDPKLNFAGFQVMLEFLEMRRLTVQQIEIETSTKMYTPFLIGLNLRYGPYAHFGY